MSLLLDIFFKILALIILHQLLSFYVQRAEAVPLATTNTNFPNPNQMDFRNDEGLGMVIDPDTYQRYCCVRDTFGPNCYQLNGFEQCIIASPSVPS